MAHYLLKECLGGLKFREITRFEGGQPEILAEIHKAKVKRYIVEQIAPPIVEEPTIKAPVRQGKKSAKKD